MRTFLLSRLIQLWLWFLVFQSVAIVTFGYCEPFNLNVDQSFRMLNQNVKLVTLSNGMRVLLYRRGEAPIFAGVVAVRVGGADEEIGHTGISHMLEHMAFKGTTLIGTKNFQAEKVLLDQLEEIMLSVEGQTELLTGTQQQKVASITMALQQLWKVNDFTRQYEVRGGQGMNAYTSKDQTVYMVSLPKNAFEFWCWAESERLLNPVMRQFYEEREVVKEERRMRYVDDPDGRLYETLLGVSYLSHPYRNPVIGYDFDLARLTATATEEFHKRFYIGQNIVISVVGDIDIDRDLPVIEKYFGRIPLGQIPSRPHSKELEVAGERSVTIEFPASGRVFIAYKKPVYPDEDDVALTVLSEMLAGSRITELYRELVEHKRLVSNIDVEQAPGDAQPNLLLFSAQLNSGVDSTTFLSEFDRVIEKFKVTKVDNDLLDIAKRNLFIDQLQNLSSNMSLAVQLANTEQIYPEGWRALLSWYRKAMKVSSDDIARVAKKYLDRNMRTVGRIEGK